ncbi:MAG: N-glycosylase/DNA lyase [Candidatus Diapherotrites archaeon]|uniref:8-oxoguanine DNA glycosylase/AP lyase n=1 Tax=Candidatus Iainarchaeum sp. TaxID=3101447 RepID=A0A8T3YJU7_9ARCH|nr:N-glycosylase/DNA lyase [Candidatus Diapherotrites archaeon]
MVQSLLGALNSLAQGPVSGQVLSRYNDFKSFSAKGEEAWFSELCFCLMTANSSAQMGLKVQDALGFGGFYNLSQKKLTKELKALGYRFYNKRAEYIVEARKHFGIKGKLVEIGLIASEGDGRVTASEIAMDRAKRAYLSENVKGFGLKEASHFLRNTGHDNCAILDRHIIRLMYEHAMITETPKTITARNYFAIESVLDTFAEEAGLNHSILDLYLWYMKTGKVLK